MKRVCVLIVVVRADPGNIGGSLSHEYHVTSGAGEDTIITCERLVITIQAKVCGLGVSLEPCLGMSRGQAKVCGLGVSLEPCLGMSRGQAKV